MSKIETLDRTQKITYVIKSYSFVILLHIVTFGAHTKSPFLHEQICSIST